MTIALLLHPIQWVAAYLALDLVFRRIPLEPEGLRQRIRLYRRRYTLAAAALCLAVGVLQLRAAGLAGAVPALAGWLPWWLLWRFGWRKQFTFLYLPTQRGDMQ